jgi:hypothetical protein
MLNQTADLMSSGTYFLVHTLETRGTLREDPQLGQTATRVTTAWKNQSPYDGMHTDIETLAQRAGEIY